MVKLTTAVFLLKAEPFRRYLSQSKNKTTKLIDFFWNTIKQVVQPSQTGSRLAPNETTKGLDMKFSPGIASFPTTFGNSEDFKLIYLGTKWCGAGDVAKSEIDVGYFYLTGMKCSNIREISK